MIYHVVLFSGCQLWRRVIYAGWVHWVQVVCVMRRYTGHAEFVGWWTLRNETVRSEANVGSFVSSPVDRLFSIRQPAVRHSGQYWQRPCVHRSRGRLPAACCRYRRRQRYIRTGRLFQSLFLDNRSKISSELKYLVGRGLVVTWYICRSSETIDDVHASVYNQRRICATSEPVREYKHHWNHYAGGTIFI